MGCVNSKDGAKAKDMYLDPENNLHIYDPSVPIKRVGSEELEFVANLESKEVHGGEEFYLISVGWLAEWLAFAKGTGGVSAFSKKIDNQTLVDPQFPHKLRVTARFKKEFRVIDKEVWEYYFERYGGGPVIVFYVPTGFSEAAYKTGEWIKASSLPELVTVVDVKHAIEHCTPCMMRNPLSDSDMMAEDNMKLAANLLVGDLASSKFKEAKALDGEINAANAEAVGAAMARDLGKAKMKAANAMSAEVNETNTELIASMMGNDLAKQKVAAAKAKEDEANKAAAEAIANQLAGDLATQKLKAAKEAEDREREEQEKRIMESFKGMGAKMRFKAALASGKDDVAENAAAEMLQGAWRCKVAARQVLAKREEKERLRQEAYAKKLQAKYRTRLARKRVATLRAEKERMMEEAMAVKLQCAWKAKKARRKVAELKAKRQALREEGCAIMLQCAWKAKRARRRVAELKARKQALLEEASALLVQSRWRIKQAQRRVGNLREQRKEQIRKENSSAVILGSRIRRYLAIRRVFNMQRSFGYVVAVNFKSASDVNVSDLSSSDPYVLASGVVNGASGATSSMYRTKVISNTLNPVWNEEGFVAGLKGTGDVIVLTMFDKDLVSADDFMGQNVITLKDCASIRRGQVLDLVLDIGSFHAPLKGVNGEAISVNGSDTPGKGKLNLSLRMPSLAFTMCGYVMRLSHSMMSATWKKRYFILVDKKLYYYDDPAELNVVKGMIDCSTVTAIKEEKTKGVDHFTITYGSGKDKWDFKFVDEDSNSTIAMWKRKIARSCNRIPAGGSNCFLSALTGPDKKQKR